MGEKIYIAGILREVNAKRIKLAQEALSRAYERSDEREQNSSVQSKSCQTRPTRRIGYIHFQDKMGEQER